MIVSRHLQLADDDLAVLRPVALISACVVIRAGVFALRRSSGYSTARTSRDR